MFGSIASYQPIAADRSMPTRFVLSSGERSGTRSRRRRGMWIGLDCSAEITLARQWLEGVIEITSFPTIASALESVSVAVPAGRSKVGGDHGAATPPLSCPDVILLATDRPGRWTTDDALRLSLAWPLAPLFAVASSLADGRRRSGPPFPGVEEIAWHDLPGRLIRWFSDLDSGYPGSLGLPTTARREDRFLEAPLFSAADHPLRPAVTVVARRPLDLDGLADLLAAAGYPIFTRTLGRPGLEGLAGLVVWDAERIEGGDLEWLRMLAANSPGTAVVILESFPRGDTLTAALWAGAAAVLSRPVGLETLVGTLDRLARRP